MDLGLGEKVAAVAASSRGLGFAVARELAREGAYVGICSRDRVRIEQAAAKIRAETGAEVFAVPADLSRRDKAGGFVEAVAAHFGRLDILVTNAGGPPPGGIDDLDLELLERSYRLTLESAVAMIEAAVPHMRKNRWGRIVNIVSITVKQPETNLLMSNTMRAAVVGFAKSISLELARDNVLVNNVAPGYTRTERLVELAEDIAKREHVSEGEVFSRWEKRIPMGRLGEPEELARVVTFLASEAASYVTGTTLQVDGGFVQSVL